MERIFDLNFFQNEELLIVVALIFGLLIFASLLFFILGGQVVWVAGLAMAGGQFLGARLGSNMVVTRGSRIIRPMLVTVSLVMSARLLWQQYPQLFSWIS